MLYIEELPAENKQKQDILLPFLKKSPAALDDCAAVEFQCRRYNCNSISDPCNIESGG